MNTNVHSFTSHAKPLTIREAQKHIRAKAQNSSSVQLTFHAKERMAERNLTIMDVFTIVREGFITYAPEKREGRWTYKVTFIKYDGARDASCIVEIKLSGKLKIVTVMWRE